MSNCPCGNEAPYSVCCEPFITKTEFPATPEQLMRSRFTAYATGNVDYIFETMDGLAAKDFDKEEATASSAQIKWGKLQIITAKQLDEDTGTVEFVAHYSLNGVNDMIYEISLFSRKNERWYYVDGMTPKIGRNDNCPCQSGKKFKKCCLKGI